jgi:hypothetical protein
MGCRLIMWALVALFCACTWAPATASEYSLKDQGIRSGIPTEILNYTSGPMIAPDDAAVALVVDFATKSREGQAFQYAYIFKKEQGWSNGNVYVHVQTPLQLIGEHARHQAREYRAVDREFVDFARGLRVVRLMVTEEGMSSNLRASGVSRPFILLRDGQRVEPASNVPMWRGNSVFAPPASQVRPTVATPYLSEQQLTDMEANYRRAGLSEENIARLMGMLKGRVPTPTNPGDVFPIEDLTRPGIYEIVFRHPPSNSMLYRGDDEIRVPVSFAGFR